MVGWMFLSVLWAFFGGGSRGWDGADKGVKGD